jgi:hypothetical protein
MSKKQGATRTREETLKLQALRQRMARLDAIAALGQLPWHSQGVAPLKGGSRDQQS